jgi:hypothetical protein
MFCIEKQRQRYREIDQPMRLAVNLDRQREFGGGTEKDDYEFAGFAI